MSLKKVISGLLSVTALASMTAVPALANETLTDGLSIADAQDGLFNLGGGSVDSAGTVEQFLSVKTKEDTDTAEEGKEQDMAAAEAADAEEEARQTALAAFLRLDEMEEVVVNDEPVEVLVVNDLYKYAVESYNVKVLPELSVSLDTGNLLEGFALPGQEVVFENGASCASGVQKPEAADGKLVVASPNVYMNLHAEPSLGSEIVGRMYGNDVAIELRKENERWTRVRSGNVVGYVLNEYLVDGEKAQVLSDLAGKQVATIDENKGGTIHQDSDDYSKVVARAVPGDQYEVTEGADGWLGILMDDGEGYIQASDVTLSMAYPVAESARQEEERISRSNVKERADHEQRKADKADAVAELARVRADVASGQDEETATAVVEVALRAADAAAAQANVARVAVSQAGEESGQAVIEFATQFIGNPYVWGGSSLTHGADCSGFVMAVYGNFGFRLPHYDVSDRSVGLPVASLAEARAGDIVCYYGHVGLYMGDGMIVHAQDERHGITTSRADFMHIVCIRRLFN